MERSSRWSLMSVAATGLLCSSAWASQDPLSVDDAVKVGLKNNPQVVAGKAGVESAYSNYRSIAAFSPITLTGTHVQGTSTAPTLNGTNNDTFVDLGETFDLSGQKRF